MAASPFDTLAAADELREAGFDEKQTRAIIGIQRSAGEQLATKADVEVLRSDFEAFAGRMEATLYRALWIQGTGVVLIIGAFIAIAAALKRL